jgi:competence protein ComEA
MSTERKNIFTRGDILAVLLLIACLLLGGALIILQKSTRQLPPELVIQTVTQAGETKREAVPSSPPKTGSPMLLININSAPADSLELLPGIGPVYASRIIDYRNTHGAFESLDELTDIRGIGPKTLKKIENLITLE